MEVVVAREGAAPARTEVLAGKAPDEVSALVGAVSLTKMARRDLSLPPPLRCRGKSLKRRSWLRAPGHQRARVSLRAFASCSTSGRKVFSRATGFK